LASIAFTAISSLRAHQVHGAGSCQVVWPITPGTVAGGVGYFLTGLGVPGLPEGSVGFLYLPALAGIVVASVLTAPLGARATHKLPVPTLRKIFAFFLYTLALRMAWVVFH
jgi:uncharacterized membrane protein YfcA